ncbi:fatty acid-binding protein, liver-like [Elysia marginata]|uniref:Fatty acid-binding protein, liver-like n=1 Tax=Elysia marginata TaxID=1093978 RepID=A0AAV4HET3_9GAST|nr:fatty acid-binding protein, liver-like [Elysia marginata]
MNPAFFGKWNLDKSRTTGKEDFAKAFNIPDEQFAQIDKIQITLTISQEGDAYKFEMDFNGAAPSQTVLLTPGVESEVVAMDGSKAKVTLSVEGDGVKESYTSAKGDWILTRSVDGNEQKSVTTAKGVTLTQYLVRA